MTDKEMCPSCKAPTLEVFIDPEIGGYVKCMKCGYLMTEADLTEE